MKTWSYAKICFAIAICHQIVHGARPWRNTTDNTLKYSKYAYAAFSAVKFSDNSTFIFRFKTLKKDGMLFYMDDGGVKDFIDAFLLNGQLRIRLTLGSCRGIQLIINGSFTDLNWHKIILKRNSYSVIVAIDGYNTSYNLCSRLKETDFKRHGPMYVSYFPVEEWNHLKWKFRDSWKMSMKHGGFEGCIKTPKYAVGDNKFRRARLLKTQRTFPGCRDACKDPSFGGECYNGGKCVNKIVRRECDCRGTGYHGSNCSQVIVVDSMAGLHFSGQFNKVLLKGSYAEFNGWPMAEISELQFYFKTDVAKPALLLYQDTGGKDGYLEISFLSNGNVRLQLAGSKCSFVQKSIEKNFTEDTWHKLSISRRRAELRFSVDNVSAPIIRCLELPRLSGQNGKAKRSLFIGGIPFQNSRGDPMFEEWSQAGLPGRMLTEENSWFEGCIALLRYSSASKPFENVKLLKSHDVDGNCSDKVCSSEPNLCQHGGRCVDLVTRTECDCEGTGYYGQYCEQSDKLIPTAAINTSTSAGSKHSRPVKSDSNDIDDGENNNNSNNKRNSSSAKAKEKKSSSGVSSPGWCLCLSAALAVLLMRNVVALM